MPVPIVSFTFDDAPRTAFTTAAEILMTRGARATFFMSLGLLSSETEVGPIATEGDLASALKQGHELGCHTFDHLDAWYTATREFVRSVEKNKRALDGILPGAKFRTFAYPKSGPNISTKLNLEKYFVCCRGGGQAPNLGTADLNLLKGFFLNNREQDTDRIRRVIDENASACGWLIFATHDVSDDPSPHGCTSSLFAKTVEYAARSGALLLPVGEAYDRVVAPS
jgi:peptidoglycan/xylan/chitin deacetylase (PgdA/CDA1 family)